MKRDLSIAINYFNVLNNYSVFILELGKLKYFGIKLGVSFDLSLASLYYLQIRSIAFFK
jgi:hypothetical protein